MVSSLNSFVLWGYPSLDADESKLLLEPEFDSAKVESTHFNFINHESWVVIHINSKKCLFFFPQPATVCEERDWRKHDEK